MLDVSADSYQIEKKNRRHVFLLKLKRILHKFYKFHIQIKDPKIEDM
jgi:hypothetical protein